MTREITTGMGQIQTVVGDARVALNPVCRQNFGLNRAVMISPRNTFGVFKDTFPV